MEGRKKDISEGKKKKREPHAMRKEREGVEKPHAIFIPSHGFPSHT